MKATITVEDDRELLRLTKSSDMAVCLWELKHNFWRKWKHSSKDITLDELTDAIADLLEEHNINPDELTG